MASLPGGPDRQQIRWLGWIRNIVGIGVILAETVGVYVLLRSLDVPDVVAYGATAVTAVVIAGSALYVGGRRISGSGSATDSGEKSTLTRTAEVVVSVTVLTAVTVSLGSLGGLGLTMLAMAGGPDPKTADDEPLRRRLLGWSQRNREFMRANGSGRLPLKP